MPICKFPVFMFFTAFSTKISLFQEQDEIYGVYRGTLGMEANQHMVSFSPVLCGLHSREPGTLTQAFKSSKGQEYSQFISLATSQEEDGL